MLQTLMTPSPSSALSIQPTTAPSSFTIPSVFDPVFYNVPDAHSVLVHSVSSSTDEPGFQAIICLHPRPDLPAHLGLPPLSNYEDKAFLQVAPEHQPFLLQSQAPRCNAMQVTATEYLILLQFAINEWPRLKAKLTSQLETMCEGTDPIYMTGHLVYYNHGSSHYRVSISSRLVFKACIESRDKDQIIKTWLERRSLSDPATTMHSNVDPLYQEMALPMKSLLTLTQDSAGFKALVDLVAAYKNRSRKRSKTVVS